MIASTWQSVRIILEEVGGPGKLFWVDVVYFIVENFYPASNNINSLWQSSEIYEI